MIYMIAALVAGVFYRELTKFNQFTGKTTLSVTHTHLFILGVFVFLLLALPVRFISASFTLSIVSLMFIVVVLVKIGQCNTA